MCVFHVAILLAFLSCTLYIATWLHPNLMSLDICKIIIMKICMLAMISK